MLCCELEIQKLGEHACSTWTETPGDVRVREACMTRVEDDSLTSWAISFKLLKQQPLISKEHTNLAAKDKIVT